MIKTKKKCDYFNKNCLTHVGYNCLLVIILIFIYLIILQFLISTKKFDPLMNVQIPIIGNGWNFSHLLFFLILGYYFPFCFIEAMLAGIAWEIFEFTVGYYLPIIAPSFARSLDPNWGDWYYGSFWDVVMNLAGFLIGVALNYFFIVKKNYPT